MHFADFLSGSICSVETEAAAVHFHQNRIGAYSPWSRAESRDLIRNAVVVLVRHWRRTKLLNLTSWE